MNKEAVKPFVRMAVKWGLAAGGLGGVGMMMMDNPSVTESMPSILGGGVPAEVAVETAITEVVTDAVMDGGAWFFSGLWDVVSWPFVKIYSLF